MSEETSPQESDNVTVEGKENQEESKTAPPQEEEEIDLNDPEVEKAAEKIQASFKGFKARKEVNAMRVGQGHLQRNDPVWTMCTLHCSLIQS